jgi:putative protease
MRERAMRPERAPELICPAGGLPALKAAVDHGADGVYLGFRDETNARAFAGLNFDDDAADEGIRYARRRGVKTLLALNTYPKADNWPRWTRAVDRAAALGFDAVIMADPGLMAYARANHPDLDLHLSVQGSATSHEAINLYHRQFGIRRAVLPRVLSLPQVENVANNTPVGIELFGFGGLCVMVEGRCLLSSYTAGDGPNTCGVCSPAKAVRWTQTPRGLETRLNGVLLDRHTADEHPGYPTLCKGRFEVGGQTYYALEEPTSLNTMDLLPEMFRMGIAAIKIEGRQRSPAYVAQVTRAWRAAIDACRDNLDGFTVNEAWRAPLAQVAEGSMHTLGAYYRPWK